MKRYTIACAGLMIALRAAAPAQQGPAKAGPDAPSPQAVSGSPSALCAQIAFAINRDLVSLQPINGYVVDAGLARWDEMREGLPRAELERYDRSFSDLESSYGFVLDAAETWAIASSRISVPIDAVLAMKFGFRNSVESARLLLQRAVRGCRPGQPSKP